MQQFYLPLGQGWPVAPTVASQIVAVTTQECHPSLLYHLMLSAVQLTCSHRHMAVPLQQQQQWQNVTGQCLWRLGSLPTSFEHNTTAARTGWQTGMPVAFGPCCFDQNPAPCLLLKAPLALVSCFVCCSALPCFITLACCAHIACPQSCVAGGDGCSQPDHHQASDGWAPLCCSTGVAAQEAPGEAADRAGSVQGKRCCCQFQLARPSVQACTRKYTAVASRASPGGVIAGIAGQRVPS